MAARLARSRRATASTAPPPPIASAYRSEELANGNLVTTTQDWDHPDGTVDVGAATWIDRSDPIVGPVTVDNSLHGTTTSDRIGRGTAALANGNYVVQNSSWNLVDGATTRSGVGAATWGDGDTGISGPVTTSNSLHGTTTGDRVGFLITQLADGDYIVRADSWDHPDGTIDVGAAVWADGTTGITGPVGLDNSLHGITTDDSVGERIFALTNGNYVVASPAWDDPAGPTTNVGAVTWGNGNGGTIGPVTTTNSLHGTTANDNVGGFTSTPKVISLSNGNYVVGSLNWNHPDGTANVGAVTWGDGNGGTTGPVTTTNSLHGTTADDDVGTFLVALDDGNYVASQRDWDHPDGTVDVGSATWGNGNGGTTGPVTTTNSLHGTTPQDDVGTRVNALDDPAGSYVVFADQWDDPDGPVVDTGAVAFGLPGGASTGPVSRANSVIGTPIADFSATSGRDLTSGDGVVIGLEAQGLIVMLLDRAPFFGTAAPDVNAATEPGADTATVDFTAPTATDLRSDPSVTCVPASGSVFAIGDTSITCTATDSAGQTATTSFILTVTATPANPDPDLPADVTAIDPERILETRVGDGLTTSDGLFEGDGQLAAGQEIELQVGGRGGIPTDATAAFLNVTAIRPDTAGFLTLYPCDTERPNTSNVNYGAGDIAPNAVLAKLSATGTVCIFTNATTHLIADTAGFIPTGGTTSPVDPERILETRNGPGLTTIDGLFEGDGQLAAGQEIELQVGGRGGIPTDATAAFLNVTAIRPDTAGFLTLYPCDTERPNTSNVNYGAGDIAPNAVLAKLSATGTVCIFTNATTHLIADTAGFIPTGGTTSPVDPERILETRVGPGLTTIDGLFEGDRQLAAGQEVELQIAGRGGIPADATAAFLNVTAIRPDTAGFLTLYPCDTERPNTSNVNYGAGDIAPNAVLAKLSATGTVCIFTNATTNLIADTAGFVPTTDT